MRASHGVLLLAVALVVLSSDIISTGMAAREEDGPFPPESTCMKVISSGHCDPVKCNDDCSKEINSSIYSECGGAGCMCFYYCDPPPAAN